RIAAAHDDGGVAEDRPGIGERAGDRDDLPPAPRIDIAADLAHRGDLAAAADDPQPRSRHVLYEAVERLDHVPRDLALAAAEAPDHHDREAPVIGERDIGLAQDGAADEPEPGRIDGLHALQAVEHRFIE